MSKTHIPFVVISGPVGVGKTTVGHELSGLLEESEIPHTFVDLDALAWTYPYPADDRYGSRIALCNLRDMWFNCVAAGSRNLILARVIETPDQLQDMVDVVPRSVADVWRLSASPENLIRRVEGRELGSGLDWHRARALELARLLDENGPADHVTDTDGRLPREVAEEIFASVRWKTADA